MVGEEIIVAIVRLLRGSREANTVDLGTFPPVPTVAQIWSTTSSIEANPNTITVLPSGHWDLNFFNEGSGAETIMVQVKIHGTFRTTYTHDIPAGEGWSTGPWVSDGVNWRVGLLGLNTYGRFGKMS